MAQFDAPRSIGARGITDVESKPGAAQVPTGQGNPRSMEVQDAFTAEDKTGLGQLSKALSGVAAPGSSISKLAYSELHDNLQEKADAGTAAAQKDFAGKTPEEIAILQSQKLETLKEYQRNDPQHASLFPNYREAYDIQSAKSTAIALNQRRQEQFYTNQELNDSTDMKDLDRFNTEHDDSHSKTAEGFSDLTLQKSGFWETIGQGKANLRGHMLSKVAKNVEVQADQTTQVRLGQIADEVSGTLDHPVPGDQIDYTTLGLGLSEHFNGDYGVQSHGGVSNPKKLGAITQFLKDYTKNRPDLPSDFMYQVGKNITTSPGRVLTDHPEFKSNSIDHGITLTRLRSAEEAHNLDVNRDKALGYDGPEGQLRKANDEAKAIKDARAEHEDRQARQKAAGIQSDKTQDLSSVIQKLSRNGLPSTHKEVRSLLDELTANDPTAGRTLETYLRVKENDAQTPFIEPTRQMKTMFALNERRAKGEVIPTNEILKLGISHIISRTDVEEQQKLSNEQPLLVNTFPVLKSEVAKELRASIGAGMPTGDETGSLKVGRNRQAYDQDVLAWLKNPANKGKDENQFSVEMRPIAEKYADKALNDEAVDLKKEAQVKESMLKVQQEQEATIQKNIEKGTPDAKLIAEETRAKKEEEQPLPEHKQAKIEANKALFARQPLTPQHIGTLLSRKDGNEITDAAARVWRPGIEEKPLSERDLKDLIKGKIQWMYPGQPAALATAIEGFSGALKARYNPPKSNTTKESQVKSYGSREDGSAKGSGYFGELPRPGGKGFSTELSATGDLNDAKGAPILYPLLVPTLTKQEINSLLLGNEPTPGIYHKAELHAARRIKQGKSPFAQTGEPLYALPQ